MKHFATAEFWACYERLPSEIQRQADFRYNLLRQDPAHPSLHFKRIGRFWSVRVSLGFRALAVPADDGLVWFWIGSHADYDRLLQDS